MFENAIKVLKCRANLGDLDLRYAQQYPALFPSVQVSTACGLAAEFLEHPLDSNGWDDDTFEGEEIPNIIYWGVLCSSPDIPAEELAAVITKLQEARK